MDPDFVSPGRRCSEASSTQSPAVAADQKILASAPPAADISTEAGVPDRSTIANADRLRSDPMNLVGHARRRESTITASVTASPSLPKTVDHRRRGHRAGHRLAAGASRLRCQRLRSRARPGTAPAGRPPGCSPPRSRPSPARKPLLALTLESQRLWPDFARELEAASGISVGYRDEGTIVVALTRDDAEQLRHTYQFQKGLGLDIEWLSGADARQREPHLRPGIPAAVLSPRDHQVENRAVARALAAAARQRRGACPRALPGPRDRPRRRPGARRRHRARARARRCRGAGRRRLVARDRRHPGRVSAAGAADQGPDAGARAWTRRRRCCAMSSGCRAAIWCRGATGG